MHPPSRARASVERRSVAGIAAFATGLLVAGVTLVADASPADRDAAGLALRTDPLGAVTAVFSGGEEARPGRPALAAGSDPVAIADERVAAEPVLAAPDAQPPRAMRVDSLDLDAPVEATGLLEDRTLEVPEDASRIGWYERFAQPGDPGVSVLLGHVDSRRGPGVFFRLPELGVGDRLEVERGDGAVVTYAVERVDRYPKDDFPTKDVFTDPRPEVLRVITCGGEFDRERRTYLDNVVVTALPLPDVPPSPADGPR